MTAAVRIDPREEPRSIADTERAVLGALVTGALGVRDVEFLGEAFTVKHHADMLVVLVALLMMRTGSRKGIDLATAIRACNSVGVRPVGYVGIGLDGRPRSAGYLPTMAREAPSRGAALAACAELREHAAHRWDVDRDRDALAEAGAEVLESTARAFLGMVADEGIRLRSGVARPIDRDAMPARDRVLKWSVLVMLKRLEEEMVRSVVAADEAGGP